MSARSEPDKPLAARPTIRAGTYAWAFVGLALALWIVGLVLGRLSVVVVPLVLALFPAAVLMPPTRWLRRLGAAPSVAALVVLLVTLGLLVLLGRLLVPAIASEIPGVVESAREGVQQLRGFLSGIGVDQARIDRGLEQLRDQLQTGDVASGVLGAAVAVAEGVAALLFGFVVLFFYLKDGDRIAAWLRDLFPRRLRTDATEIATRAWDTVGSYIRGQLLIALVDAVFIGIGLAVLRVPLALPLSVIVFLGGLFPIVGAFAAGILAALVALATGGVVKALLVVALIVVVQQVEGNVLAPIVLGRATQLHALAVIAALTAGAVLLGVLGAFLAVPIAASLARAVGYLRERVPG